MDLDFEYNTICIDFDSIKLLLDILFKVNTLNNTTINLKNNNIHN